MSGFKEINEEMSALSREIEILSGQLEAKRSEYETSKHAYELAYSGHILTGKIMNPNYTQTDLEAYAIQQSSEVKARMILAHGAYRKLKADLSAKQGLLDTVREQGWNLRQELKRLA